MAHIVRIKEGDRAITVRIADLSYIGEVYKLDEKLANGHLWQFDMHFRNGRCVMLSDASQRVLMVVRNKIDEALISCTE